MDATELKQIKLALIAVLSTAASAGVDIDFICHEAAEHLLGEEAGRDVTPLAPGAVVWLGIALEYVTEPQP